MNLEQYLGKMIEVSFHDGTILTGRCNTFTSRLNTEEEICDEITIKTAKHPYVCCPENEIKSIKII